MACRGRAMRALHALQTGDEEHDPSLAASDEAGERELIDQARRDPEACARLYRAHYPAIQCYLRRRLGSPEVVEDAVADTFVAALQNLPRYQYRGIPFRAWLYRLATSSANRLRRRAAGGGSVRAGPALRCSGQWCHASQMAMRRLGQSDQLDRCHPSHLGDLSHRRDRCRPWGLEVQWDHLLHPRPSGPRPWLVLGVLFALLHLTTVDAGSSDPTLEGHRSEYHNDHGVELKGYRQRSHTHR